MKTLLVTLAAGLLLLGSMTACQSAEEKLAAKGCECLSKEDKMEARKCLAQMAEDEPRLKEEKAFGDKIEAMMKESCPEAAEAY